MYTYKIGSLDDEVLGCWLAGLGSISDRVILEIFSGYGAHSTTFKVSARTFLGIQSARTRAISFSCYGWEYLNTFTYYNNKRKERDKTFFLLVKYYRNCNNSYSLLNISIHMFRDMFLSSVEYSWPCGTYFY